MAPFIPAAIGKYAIERWVASGGMGDIYLARDPTLDRPVAIKFLREGFDNEETRERFEREARAAGRLSHPNIVTIYEFGEFDGRPYIAMEFVAGQPLSKLIRQKQDLPTTRKLEMMEGLCAGLAHAHRAGIVHRDIKPANLMVDAEGALKVLDFGIVRMAGSGLTNAGVLVGTVNYMSPEQIAGSSTIDHRSDVFAVGTVMYELFAYRRAFPGEMAEVLYRIVHTAPDSIAEVCPTLDPAIARAVMKCLEKPPERRYQDLTVLRRELGRVRHRLELEEMQDPPSHAGLRIAVRPAVPAGRPGEAQRLEAERQRARAEHEHAERARQAQLARQAEEARQAEMARQAEAERLRLAEIERQRQAELARQEEAERRRREAEQSRRAAAEAERQAREAAEAERRAEAQRRREAIAARQKQVDEQLANAQQAIDADQPSAARLALDTAVSLGAPADRVDTLKAQLDARTRELRQVVQALDAGEARLAAGAADEALAAADEALRLRPRHRLATDLRDRARAAIDARRKAEAERQRRIDGWLAEARETRDEAQAIATLAKIFEIDPANVAAREQLDAVRRAQLERRQRREAQIARGRAAVQTGRFGEAVEALRPLAPEAAADAELAALLRDAEAGFERAEAERRRQEAIAARLAEAGDRLAQEDFRGAGTLVDQVLADDPGHGRARALRDEIAKGEAALARAEQAVATARQLFEAAEPAQAIGTLEAFRPAHALVTRALGELRARHEAAERARRRAEQRARRQAAIASAIGRVRDFASRRSTWAALAVLAVTLAGAGLWTRWSGGTTDTPAPTPPPSTAPSTSASSSGTPSDPATTDPGPAAPATPTPTKTGPTPAPATPTPENERRSPAEAASRRPDREPETTVVDRTPSAPAPSERSGSSSEGTATPPPTSSPEKPPAAAAPEPTPVEPVREATTRVPSVPAPPAPAAPSPAQIAEREIRTWIQEYENAYAALDFDRVRQLGPGSQRKEMLNSAKVRFENVRIEPAADGRSARLTARVNYEYDWKRAGLKPRSSQQITWQLERAGGGWVASVP